MKALQRVLASAAITVAFYVPSRAAEKIEYEGYLEASVAGTRYTTNNCDKDDPEKCGSCWGSSQEIVPDEWTKVQLECVAYDDRGMALGINLETTDLNQIVTDTTGSDPRNRILGSVDIEHPNGTHGYKNATTNEDGPLRDPDHNFIHSESIGGRCGIIELVFEFEMLELDRTATDRASRFATPEIVWDTKGHAVMFLEGRPENSPPGGTWCLNQ